MRQKHGWRISVELLNSCSHREQGLWKEPFCDTWDSEFIALQEAGSGLKQLSLYHYIASLGDGTADTDGWLAMTVHDGGFKHTAQKAEHIWKGSVLALYSLLFGGWWLKRLFLYGSAALPWFLVSRPYLPMLCTITYLPRWKEWGAIRFILELVHNLASALALRAPLAQIISGPNRLPVHSWSQLTLVYF